jgi:hypothetical protein
VAHSGAMQASEALSNIAKAVKLLDDSDGAGPHQGLICLQAFE